MSTEKLLLPAPTLTDRQGNPLAKGEISLDRNSAGIDIHVDTTGVADGTAVTAYFNVLDNTGWSWTLPSKPELKFTVESSLFNNHKGKTAKVKCSIAGVDSAMVSAPIVD